MKTKKNSNLSGIIILIGVIFFIALTVYAFIKDGKSSEFVEEVSYSELQSIIKKKDKNIVLIGRDNCSHCISYKPTIESVAKQYKIKVYYINTNTIDNEEEYDTLWDFFDAGGTPTTAVVSDGKLIAREEGELTRSKLISFLKANYF
ncbi:MAG: thioredoxin family protein [Bacilli bacterium]|nr:thioredoxin family protein [Bacilli bacterium]